MTMDHIRVKIAQSEFGGETKSPQFRVQRVQIFLGPSIDGFPDDEISKEYRDNWSAIDAHPTEMYYRFQPSTVQTENSLSGSVGIGLAPSIQLRTNHARSTTSHLPPLAQVIDLSKSEFHETPHGGLMWDYHVLSRHVIELNTHRGQSTLPISNPPSSFEANVVGIFEICNPGSPGSIFSAWRLANSMKIGYRHLKIGMKVDVHWCKKYFSQIPRTDCPGGHETTISHRFQVRGGAEPIRPKRTFLPSMDTEVSLEGSNEIRGLVDPIGRGKLARKVQSTGSTLQVAGVSA